MPMPPSDNEIAERIKNNMKARKKIIDEIEIKKIEEEQLSQKIIKDIDEYFGN